MRTVSTSARTSCYISFLMRSFPKTLLAILTAFAALLLLHWPLLRLPYFWDEAGYYVPAALDFYRSSSLIPYSTMVIGHTPLVSVYLGVVWRLFGYSTWATRGAMTSIAAGTVAALYGIARRVASREIAVWSVLLLAVSPIFFAQSTLVHLDLPVALFTSLAVLCLLSERLWLFALAASLAVLSKETALILLPVVWLDAWRNRRQVTVGRPTLLSSWAPLVVPLAPLAVWTLYYHHATGFWTGNREYLSYNLYSTLSPARVFFSLLRRVYELLISGFNWLLTACALWGFWWGRKHESRDSGIGNRESADGLPEAQHGFGGSGNEVRGSAQAALETDLGTRIPYPVAPGPYPDSRFPIPEPRIRSLKSRVPSPENRPANSWRRFLFLAGGVTAVYLILLSVVGGAILPRYLLPVLPLFYLAAVAVVTRLPHFPARLLLATAAVCFVSSWFINPPYPFPFEDNLSYADFIRLHQQAAQYLETRPGQPRILTAWPASDELTKPALGYVQRPLRVVPAPGFAPQEFAPVRPESFDLLYLYSRRWEPAGNWLERFPGRLRMQGRYFDYHPQVAADSVAARYHLKLLWKMQRRGQWVRVYGASLSSR